MSLPQSCEVKHVRASERAIWVALKAIQACGLSVDKL